MEPFDLASMFLLGLLGTGHCLGMCGPLVLALPGAGPRGAAHLAYHLGRVSTYALVGSAVGGIGLGLRTLVAEAGGDPLASLARLQVLVSLVSALLLLAFGLGRLGLLREPDLLGEAQPSRLPGFARIQARALEGSPAAVFAMGLLLGLLPCGLSYAAFARVLAAPGPLPAALSLLAFGAGTLPGLLALGLSGAALGGRHRKLTDLLAGVLLVGMALRVGADAIVALL